MSAALICVDPRPNEHEVCLQIASFAAATLASPDYQGKLKRVALLASPAAALEILLAAWDATDRATVEWGERRRSPLVLLPPILARDEDEATEDILRPTRDDEPWSGTLADLERAGVIERDAGPEGELADDLRRFAPGNPEELVHDELRRYNPGTIIVLGGRRSIFAELRSRSGIIAYGIDARAMRRDLLPNLILIDESAAELDPIDLLGEDLTGGGGEGREAVQAGAILGTQIARVLEVLYLRYPDPGDEKARMQR